MKEVWKDVKGYEGLYQVSNYGKIKTYYSKIPRLKKTFFDKDGYKKVSLQKNKKPKKFFVHRLVAIAFISNPKNKLEVNHIDGNKQNNYVFNLEWCTRSENELHAYKHGLINTDAVKKANSKPVIQIDKKNNEIIKTHSSIRGAEKDTGICTTSIINCCKEKTKTAGGYIWRYL